MSWLEALRELLCRLYKEWGGDCSELGQDAPDWVAAVWGKYQAHGAPALTGTERTAYLALLGDLETHLAQGGNSLESEDNATLVGLIEGLREDLGA